MAATTRESSMSSAVDPYIEGTYVSPVDRPNAPCSIASARSVRRRVSPRPRLLVQPDACDPQAAVAHERNDVERDPVFLERTRVAVQVGPGRLDRLLFDAAEVLSVEREVISGDRERREAAVSDHLGRDALLRLALTGRVAKEADVGMRVDIDEAGRDRQPCCVHDALRLGVEWHLSDRGDATVPHSDVTAGRRPATAIEQLGAAKEQVELHQRSRNALVAASSVCAISDVP